MAVQVDLLTRVRNIHWAKKGAIFIIVTREAPYYYKVVSKTATPIQRLITVPDSAKGPVFPWLVSSYKLIAGNPPTPTFLAGGFVDYEETTGRSALASAVLISNNGIDWRHVFLSETGVDGSESWFSSLNAVVRSTDAFYYDQRVLRRGLPNIGLSPWNHDQIYRSVNGETWTQVSDEQIDYGAEIVGWRSVFPPTYCTHNNCIDALGQNVPDGFIHEEMRTDILMRPKTPVTISYGIPSFDYGTSNVVEKIIGGSPPAVDKPVSSLLFVDCVAGANGIWMAGSRGGAAISFDGGDTWTRIMLGGVAEFAVRSISAAPLQDFRTAT